MALFKILLVILCLATAPYYLLVFLRIENRTNIGRQGKRISINMISECGKAVLKNIAYDYRNIFMLYIVIIFLVASLYFFRVQLEIIDAVFVGLILSLMRFDYQYYLLPDPFVYSLLWSGIIVSNTGLGIISVNASINGVVIGYLFLMLIAVFGNFIFEKPSLGQGDIKFCAAITAWIGLEYFFEFIFVSTLIGLIYGVTSRLYRKNVNNLIPFGVALGGSGIIFFLMQKFQLLAS